MENKRTKAFNAILKRINSPKCPLDEKYVYEKSWKDSRKSKWLDRIWIDEDYHQCFTNGIIAFKLNNHLSGVDVYDPNETIKYPPIKRLFKKSTDKLNFRIINPELLTQIEENFKQKCETIKIAEYSYNTFYLRHLLVILGLFEIPVYYKPPTIDANIMEICSAFGFGAIAKRYD